MAAKESSKGLVKKLGRILRLKREAFGLTREELAEESGLSPQNIAKIENGDRFVTADSLLRISTALESDPHEFFTEEKASVQKGSRAMDKVTRLLKGKSDHEVEWAHQILAQIFKGPRK